VEGEKEGMCVYAACMLQVFVTQTTAARGRTASAQRYTGSEAGVPRAKSHGVRHTGGEGAVGRRASSPVRACRGRRQRAASAARPEYTAQTVARRYPRRLALAVNLRRPARLHAIAGVLCASRQDRTARQMNHRSFVRVPSRTVYRYTVAGGCAVEWRIRLRRCQHQR